MANSNTGKPTYYIDSCVFLDLIEHTNDQEPAKTIAAIIAAAENGRFKLITSTVSIAEVWHAKAEIDNRAVDPEVEKKILRLWNPGSSPIRLIDSHELIAREAMKILRAGIEHGWKKTKGVDGIHLATAKREGADEFLTTERAMEKWAQVLGFKVCAPHFEPEPDATQNSLPFSEEAPDAEPDHPSDE